MAPNEVAVVEPIDDEKVEQITVHNEPVHPHDEPNGEVDHDVSHE